MYLNKYGVAAWLEKMARMTKSFKVASDSGLHIKKTDEKAILFTPLLVCSMDLCRAYQQPSL